MSTDLQATLVGLGVLAATLCMRRLLNAYDIPMREYYLGGLWVLMTIAALLLLSPLLPG